MTGSPVQNESLDAPAPEEREGEVEDDLRPLSELLEGEPDREEIESPEREELLRLSLRFERELEAERSCEDDDFESEDLSLLWAKRVALDKTSAPQTTANLIMAIDSCVDLLMKRHSLS